MSSVVIAASSGYAHEVFAILEASTALNAPSAEPLKLAAIAGSAPADQVAARLGVDHLSAEDWWRDLDPTWSVAVGEGPTELRRAIDVGLRSAGIAALTLVHPEATVGPFVDIGDGSIVAPGVRLTANVTIGRHTLIHTGAVLSHDDVIGDHVTISPSATLAGGVSVGDGSTIFAGATVLPGTTIGSNVTVGAGAVVNKDVRDGATVVGIPAREIESS